MKNNLSILIVLLLSIAVFAGGLLGASEQKQNKNKKGLMIQGYDPVAYFVDEEARKGSAEFSVTLDTLTWHFASAENRDRFVADPAAYTPAYGGWCAYAMADAGYTDVDPKRYLITDGRLFLFYDGFWGDTLPKWQADEAALLKKADAAWAAFGEKDAANDK